MKTILAMAALAATVAVTTAGSGCAEPPPRVQVPAAGTPGPMTYDYAKPLPGQVPQNPTTPTNAGYDPRVAAPPASLVPMQQPVPPTPPGAFNDQPLVRDHPPEQAAFVDAYNKVGRPKIAIFVNRTLEGSTIEAGDGREAATPLPAAAGATFLKPGQYDEAWARNLDYEAVENILTDWLACNGQTEIISPTLTRARLTADQVSAIEKGERFVLADITQRLDADIFVQVNVRVTRQTTGNLSFRLVGEAINTRGGRSIARAVVDVPPPLEKTTINEYTRYVARKMMDDMIGTWNSPVRPADAAPPAGGAVPMPTSPMPAPATRP